MTDSLKTALDQQMKISFHLFDYYGQGHIDINDFGTVIRSLGHSISEETALKIAQKIDDQEDGIITYEQFRTFFYAQINSKQMKEETKLAFNVMDLDKDGYISFSDLKGFLEAAGEIRTDQEITEMIRDADVDGDDHISLDQFSRLMAIR